MIPPSTMMASSIQMSVPLNIRGIQLQGAYMPNPNWQYLSRGQHLQDQLQHQEFQQLVQTSTITKQTSASPVNVGDRPG